MLPSGSNCECGCGQPTPLATITRTARGITKGQPVRFLVGHGGYVRQKRCYRCGENKLLTEFPRRGKGKHRGRTCLRCVAEYRNRPRIGRTEAVCAYNHKRRRRAEKHRSLTHAEWKTIKLHWNGCAYCGTTERPMTRDCILPLRGHGIYAVFNVVPACQSCNSSKGGKNVFDWMATKGYDDMDFERKLQIWWQRWI